MVLHVWLYIVSKTLKDNKDGSKFSEMVRPNIGLIDPCPLYNKVKKVTTIPFINISGENGVPPVYFKGDYFECKCTKWRA